MPAAAREFIQHVRQPGDLWVLRGVIGGFSEEARTRSFASLTLVRFAFVGCDYGLCGSDRMVSIRACTYFYIMTPRRCPLWVISRLFHQY